MSHCLPGGLSPAAPPLLLLLHGGAGLLWLDSALAADATGGAGGVDGGVTGPGRLLLALALAVAAALPSTCVVAGGVTWAELPLLLLLLLAGVLALEVLGGVMPVLPRDANGSTFNPLWTTACHMGARWQGTMLSPKAFPSGCDDPAPANRSSSISAVHVPPCPRFDRSF